MAGDICISYRRSVQAKTELLYRLLNEGGVHSRYDALLGAGEDWRQAETQPDTCAGDERDIPVCVAAQEVS